MASDAAPHLDTALRDPEAPAIDRASRARAVSSDLEAIFGRAAPAEAAAPRASRIRAARRGSGREVARQRLTLAGIGGVAAAALAGIAAGSLIARTPHSAPPHATAPAPALPAIAAPPASLPVEMAPLPPAQPAQAATAALAAPTPPPQAKARPAVKARAARRPKAASPCCSYAQVQAADRRLRAAYAVAVRAGVSRGEIVAARDRWASTRRRAAHDPIRLVANYRDIADDLNRAAVRARAHQARSGRHASLQPRYAAWWR
jgi:hypothetical protein